jgi:hypothetical protein
MDSTDSRRLDAGQAALSFPMTLTTGATVGWQASGDPLWLLWGGISGFLIWFGWSLVRGLAVMAARDMPNPDEVR